MEIEIYCTVCKQGRMMLVEGVLPEDTVVDSVAFGKRYRSEVRKPVECPSGAPVLGVKSHCPVCETYQFRLVSVTNDLVLGTGENLARKILEERGYDETMILPNIP